MTFDKNKIQIALEDFLQEESNAAAEKLLAIVVDIRSEYESGSEALDVEQEKILDSLINIFNLNVSMLDYVALLIERLKDWRA